MRVMRFRILRDALLKSALQDEARYSRDLPRPEEAPFETSPAAAPQDKRVVSKKTAFGTPLKEERRHEAERAAGERSPFQLIDARIRSWATAGEMLSRLRTLVK